MNDSSIQARALYWANARRGLADLRATNGLGWAVFTHALPAGWAQSGATRDTTSDAFTDLAEMPDATDDMWVHEVLAPRVAA